MMNINRFFQIFDISTRTRYRNQQETVRLQDTIEDLSCKQHLAVYRQIIDENNLKNKLNQFRYEFGRRNLYKCLAKRSSTSRSDTSEDSNKSSMNRPSLLLHDLNASIEFEKSFMPNISKKLNPDDEFCRKYCSKLQKPVNMSLKQCSERMKADIKIAIVRSARDYHIAARRNERIY